MTKAQPPAPGPDEIIVTAPDGRQVCNSREHARLGVLAEVVVTFGELGTRWQRDALWQDCWGRSYPMCGECWDTARQVAQARRPALVITGTTRAPPGRRGADALSRDATPTSRPAHVPEGHPVTAVTASSGHAAHRMA